MKKVIFYLLIILILASTIPAFFKSNKIVDIASVKKIPTYEWQSEVSFPDWKGIVNDNLAMNNMYSFIGYKDQGKIYLSINEEIDSFDLFINNNKITTDNIKKGKYEIDISSITTNGTNTIQLTNISPSNIKNAITISIPYPEIIKGTLDSVHLRKETFELIDDIITSDIKHGFSSAQLAVIKDGKLVYQNAWGNTNAYDKNGKKIKDSKKVTNDTLYDLASNTKMYSVTYAIQYLIDKNQIDLNDKIVDILGKDFVDKTIEIKHSSYKDDYPGLKNIKKWKSKITVKDVLMHQAGFPDSGHYHNEYFDAVNQKLDSNIKNLLYVKDANQEKTLLEGINKTPLIYEPGTKIVYSDIDYMLLGLVVEKITQKDLNTFLKTVYWLPMNLKHITYNPLKNGFKKNDCAATELNGNTRDGLIDFPKVRKDTIQCEVHDEEAYYTMDGVSGHAGLFANATDLAKLASIMLTGGYKGHRFFSKDIRDLFIAPKDMKGIHYGIGWWREADNKRVWYFGTQSSENTIGHQGWTGTLTMIDFENNMIIAFLTNSINTPITDNSSLEYANDFNGRYYTTASLGFVPQIIYMGLNNKNDLKNPLNSLIKDMAIDKQRDINNIEKETGKKFPKTHAIIQAKEGLEEVSKKRNK